MDDATIVVGMIFDTIGSMSDKLQKAKQAALDYFETSNPEDKFMLIGFSDCSYLVSALTDNYETSWTGCFCERGWEDCALGRSLPWPAADENGRHQS